MNTSPTTSLTSGLIGYWTFDGKDTTGTPQSSFTALDRSGSNYTFATTSFPLKIPIAPQVKAGIFGQAYEFNGQDSGTNYVAAGLYTIGTNLSTTNGTVCEWLYPYAVTATDSSNRGNLFEGWNGTNDAITFNYETTGVIRILDTSGGDNLTSASTLALRSWSLACFTWNGTAYKIYINGVEDASGGDGTMGGALRNDWNLGKAINGTISSFNGLMDEVRIYNRALSASEMKQLYKLPQTVSPSVSPTTDITNGLVGYYTMDGNDMLQNVKDKTGNGNTGYLEFVTATTSTQAIGIHGQASRFDGVDDRITLGDNPNFDFDQTNSKFTVSTWAYSTNWAIDQRTIMSKAETTGNQGGWFFRVQQDGSLQLNLSEIGSAGSALNLISTSPLSLNTLYHLAVTVDVENDVFILYVDGVPFSAALGAVTTITDIFSNTAPVWIGANGNTSQDHWAGTLDDVRVYNRVLSPTEITQLYTLGQSLHPNVSPTNDITNGLVGYWTFDGKDTAWTSATAGTVTDRSGNANTGTLTSMSQSSSPVIGKHGQGLSFDGVNDIVSTGALDLSGTNVVTASVWFKKTAGYNDSEEIILEHSVNVNSNVGFFIDIDWVAATILVTLRGNVGVSQEYFSMSEDNNWHHLVVVYNMGNSSADEISSVYVDNVLTSTTPNTTNENTGNFASQNVFIGARSGGSLPYGGSLDDVRIYSRALSATEILQLYRLGR